MEEVQQNSSARKWMDVQLLEIVRQKHRLFRRWRQTRLKDDHKTYIRARNWVR